MVALALVGMLGGCTAPDDDPGRSPTAPEAAASASSAPGSPDPNPTPADDDQSQDEWARLKSLVTAKYPDAEYSMVGSSAQPTSFHLSPAKSSGTTGLAVAVSCVGGGEWRIRVQQQNPRTVRGTCAGADAPVPDAVELDPHPTGVQIRVTPPDGVRFWAVAFYTRG